MESLYQELPSAETIDRSSYRSRKYRSSTPIFKCDSQRRITYSEWVIRPHGPFPVNPNSERLFKKISVAFTFKQITSITHSKGNIDSRLLNYQWICIHHQIPNNFPNYLHFQNIFTRYIIFTLQK